jgi:hypothetical protein
MTARPPKQRPEQIVRKVAELALNDAIELHVVMALLKRQTDEVNKRLGEAGASRAAAAVQNALLARLVILIARAYSRPKDGDLHLRVAAELLEKNNLVRQIFATGGDATKRITDFETHWLKCRDDQRRTRIEDFRHKYTAHLGESKGIPDVTSAELFDFGDATARTMELLALATGVAVKPLDTDPTLQSCAEVFWKPWSQEGAESSSRAG